MLVTHSHFVTDLKSNIFVNSPGFWVHGSCHTCSSRFVQKTSWNIKTGMFKHVANTRLQYSIWWLVLFCWADNHPIVKPERSCSTGALQGYQINCLLPCMTCCCYGQACLTRTRRLWKNPIALLRHCVPISLVGCLFSRILAWPASLSISESYRALSMSCHELLCHERYRRSLHWRLVGSVCWSTFEAWYRCTCMIRLMNASDEWHVHSDLILRSNRVVADTPVSSVKQSCWIFGGNLLLQSSFMRSLSKYRVC